MRDRTRMVQVLGDVDEQEVTIDGLLAENGHLRNALQNAHSSAASEATRADRSEACHAGTIAELHAAEEAVRQAVTEKGAALVEREVETTARNAALDRVKQLEVSTQNIGAVLLEKSRSLGGIAFELDRLREKIQNGRPDVPSIIADIDRVITLARPS